jgi:hypothetical protein
MTRLGFAVLWLLLLPFRLLFGVVFGLLALPVVVVLLPLALLFWIPFAILRFTLKLVLLVVVLPVVAIAVAGATLVAGAALVAALVVPLVPFALIGLGLWLVARPTRHSPAATVVRG